MIDAVGSASFDDGRLPLATTGKQREIEWGKLFVD